MARVDPGHFLEELRFDIRTNDLIKARLVMAHYSQMEPQIQRKALYELSKAPDTFVFPLLVACLAQPPAGQEADPALKELLYSRALDNPQMLNQMLMREVKPSHRVVLAEVAGEIKLEEATPVLLGILNEDQDEKALRGAIVSLGMIGDPSATTPISEFLYAGSVELVIAAIQSLGTLGTPTAIQRLAEKLGADPDLDYMILDLFATSQEPEALDRLNDTLSAQMAHLRNAGKQRLLDIGRKAVPVLINNLRYNDPDLLIHTLNVLGDIGDESAISPIRKLLHNEPKDANVRFAAYEALGKLPMAKGAFALAQGLNDPVDNVRSAAASAIDHNYNTVLAAGVKNMIRDEDPAERRISRTVMDTECDTIFMDLIQEEVFRQFAIEYLCRQAHSDIRSHFSALLKANGEAEMAAAIESQTCTASLDILKIFAVDDSRMILNIYRSVLHNLGCEPILFEFPAQAIDQVRSIKPDLIFTDLNMPDISGVDLTRQIRAWFSREELPIVMVTTQNESQDNEAAIAAGVNAILHKPFNEETLRAVLAEYFTRQK
jgi:CheY-like chemotaxis protein